NDGGGNDGGGNDGGGNDGGGNDGGGNDGGGNDGGGNDGGGNDGGGTDGGGEYPNPPPALEEMKLANSYYARGDYGRAYSYFKTAANKGNRDGQFMLGKMYFEGTGVVKNFRKAKTWFIKAKDNGHPDAQRYLSQIP
ncbi:MAG: tetratricopeptide repeat protein, partial [Oligoflexales bacterium]